MAVLESKVRSGPDFDSSRIAYDKLVDVLRERHRHVLAGGGEKLQQRHRERGKIPVRERIDYLIDPLSPGWASEKGSKRLTMAEAKTIMTIPVLPISYADATPLLEHLEGPVAYVAGANAHRHR